MSEPLAPAPLSGPDSKPEPAPDTARETAPARPARQPKLEDFPETGPNALGSFGARAGARIIDEILVGVPFYVGLLFLVVGTVGPDGQPTKATEELQANIPLWLVGGSVLLSIAYEVIAVAWTGQTVGKWILGLRVARYTDGKKPTWSQSALRCLLPAVAGVIAFELFGISAAGAFLVLASAFYNPLRRGWHDDAGGTIVVRTR